VIRTHIRSASFDRLVKRIIIKIRSWYGDEAFPKLAQLALFCRASNFRYKAVSARITAVTGPKATELNQFPII
jgi:hypothetical protein